MKEKSMNLKDANLGQLLFLARYTEYRSAAIVEIDRRRINQIKG